jgi:putative ABC transport system permease protein
MGFDSSVFMSMDTARHMIGLSRESGLLPSNVEGADVSSVMVKLDDGADPVQVRNAIISAHLNTDVVTSSGMLTGISSRLSNMTLLIYMLAALIFVLCIVVLAIMFSVTINERRGEFALFRAQGATRKKIIGLVMTEAALISLAGAACGILLASLIYFPFTAYIGDMLGMPFLMPTTAEIIGYCALSAAVSVLTGPLACLPPARKIGRADAYAVMREN